MPVQTKEFDPLQDKSKVEKPEPPKEANKPPVAAVIPDQNTEMRTAPAPAPAPAPTVVSQANLPQAEYYNPNANCKFY